MMNIMNFVFGKLHFFVRNKHPNCRCISLRYHMEFGSLFTHNNNNNNNIYIYIYIRFVKSRNITLFYECLLVYINTRHFLKKAYKVNIYIYIYILYIYGHVYSISSADISKKFKMRFFCIIFVPRFLEPDNY